MVGVPGCINLPIDTSGGYATPLGVNVSFTAQFDFVQDDTLTLSTTGSTSNHLTTGTFTFTGSGSPTGLAIVHLLGGTSLTSTVNVGTFSLGYATNTPQGVSPLAEQGQFLAPPLGSYDNLAKVEYQYTD